MTTPSDGSPPTTSPIDTHQNGWPWTKFVVPSIGSMKNAGASRAPLAARFLADDVERERRAEALAEERLAVAIEARHEIDDALVLDDRVPAEAAVDERCRLAGRAARGHQDRVELGDVHARLRSRERGEQARVDAAEGAVREQRDRVAGLRVARRGAR